MKGALIYAVEKGSLADELGLEKGDKLVSINGKLLRDLIQLQFEWAGEEVLLEVEKKSGEKAYYEIEKEYDEQLGAAFEQAVFDGINLCRNKCLFCFVDQMPQNMRPTLYVKDDDYRLSFLQGSYVTLTNLNQNDIARIEREHLSPLYVSVHTTVPELRVKMLGNPRAGHIMEILQELSQKGIEFHTQVVLCPGINDGDALETTFRDLAAVQGVLSMALVPVGLTTYRQGLFQLRRYEQAEAAALVNWAHQKQKECRRWKNTAFVWPADELYLLSGLPVPAEEDYEDYPQLENGVGLVRLFWDDFNRIILPERLPSPAEFLCATGESGSYALKPVVERLSGIAGLKIGMRVVANSFFGPSVTVTGLLTGQCLLKGLKNTPPGSKVLLPDVMLKDGMFLDNLTPDDVAQRLGIQLLPVPASPASLVQRILAG